MASINPQTTYNFPTIKEQPSKDVRSEETLKHAMLKVSKNLGEIQLIDQFFYEEDANSNLPPLEREWGMQYNDVISSLALASTTNLKSGRQYNLFPLILKAYERKKSLFVTAKSVDGWAFLNILEQKIIQRLQQNTQEHFSQEQKKKGWFENNNNQNQLSSEQQTNNYGRFNQ